VLRKLADLIADEAERDSGFAAALSDVLGSSPSPVQPARRATNAVSIPDPFDVYRTKNPEEFRTWLNGLTIDELRAIVREHRFDPSRLSDRWKTKERFIKVISERVESRSKQGDVFRHYGTKPRNTHDSDASSERTPL
jgi:hypothetical protein